MPTVTIHFHAFLREKLAVESEQLELASPTAGEVLIAFLRRHPEFERLAPALKLAVNTEIAPSDAPVHPSDRLDLFPPFGGG